MGSYLKGDGVVFPDGVKQAYAVSQQYTSQPISNTGILSATSTWTKPSGVLLVRIQAVGGGGSGENPGTNGTPGTYLDTGWIQFPSAQETFSISYGAAGSDPMSQWGGSGSGGTTSVTTSAGTYSAQGGSGSGGSGSGGQPGSYSAWTNTASLSGSYGKAGDGNNSANGSGTYGSQPGAVYITYYTGI